MKSFEFKNHLVQYRVEGKGEKVLVLLHGFPEDGSIFNIQWETLGEFFQILIPDLPGAGQSEFNDHLKSVEDFADMVAALMMAESFSNAVVLGHSMGGYIALALVERNPELMKGFGFIHSTAFADSEEKKEARRKSIELMENYGSAAFVRKAIPGNFDEKFRKENDALIELLIRNSSTFPTKGLQRFYEIMIDRPDRTNVLRTNKPILFLIGENDKAASKDDVLKQVTLPNTSFVHIYPNVAHMGMLEAADKVSQAIKDFVDYLH